MTKININIYLRTPLAIDYILTNRKLHRKEVFDVKYLTLTDIRSDHNLKICKLRMHKKGNKLNVPIITKNIKIKKVGKN